MHFHSLNTRFPHWFLSTYKDTIPISLVYIFVCIARRLNISAAPIDFPARVLAIVSSPEPNVPDIFLDVYGSQTKPLLSVQVDIPRLLLQAGLQPESTAQYIQPASTGAIVLRAARNILASFSNPPPQLSTVPEADLYAALYCCLAAITIFTNDERFVVNLLHNIGRFPLDPLVVLQDTLPPIMDQPIQGHLVQWCNELGKVEEDDARLTFLRSELPTPPKYFVGLVFRHATRHYIGYVYGWDVRYLFFCAIRSL